MPKEKSPTKPPTTASSGFPDYSVPNPNGPKFRVPGHAHQAMISGEPTNKGSKRSSGGGGGGSSSSQGDYTYVRDDSGGEGITVFIMDTGFDVYCPAVRQELRLTNKPVKPADRTAPSRHNIADNSYIVPKDIAMGTDIPSSIIIPGRYDTLSDTTPADIIAAATATFKTMTTTDDADFLTAIRETIVPDATRGHGTQLASLALGTRFGIAPRATPYLVKVDSMAWNTASRSWQYGRGSDPARWEPWQDALSHILGVVKERKLEGKAVVLSCMGYRRDNMAGWGYDQHGQLTKRDSDMAETVEDRWRRTFDEVVRALGTKGVPFVCSAGNEGGVCKDHVRIGDCVPGSLVECKSSMTPLCVGAMDGRSDRIWSRTSREGSRIDGRLGDDTRVFLSAPGTDISCVGYAGAVDEGCEGTSYAAAVVAGLIAYILAHPSSCKDPELQWPRPKPRPGSTSNSSKNPDPLPGYTLLNRLRGILLRLSRDHPLSIRRERAADEAEPEINVAYNGARGRGWQAGPVGDATQHQIKTAAGAFGSPDSHGRRHGPVLQYGKETAGHVPPLSLCGTRDTSDTWEE